MANNAYLRSAKREREQVNKYRSLGFIAARSAGSKSKVDVWAYHPDQKILKLIQIKTQKGGRVEVVDRVFTHDGVVAHFDWIEYKKPNRKRKLDANRQL